MHILNSSLRYFCINKCVVLVTGEYVADYLLLGPNLFHTFMAAVGSAKWTAFHKTNSFL